MIDHANLHFLAPHSTLQLLPFLHCFLVPLHTPALSLPAKLGPRCCSS